MSTEFTVFLVKAKYGLSSNQSHIQNKSINTQKDDESQSKVRAYSIRVFAWTQRTNQFLTLSWKKKEWFTLKSSGTMNHFSGLLWSGCQVPVPFKGNWSTPCATGFKYVFAPITILHWEYHSVNNLWYVGNTLFFSRKSLWCVLHYHTDKLELRWLLFCNITVVILPTYSSYAHASTWGWRLPLF